MAGRTDSSPAHPAPSIQASFSDRDDAFVARLNANGSALVYSTFLGGWNVDEAYSVARGRRRQGHRLALHCPTTSPLPQVRSLKVASVFPWCHAAFVTQFSPDGSALLYSTFLGSGASVLRPATIAVNDAGQASVTG